MENQPRRTAMKIEGVDTTSLKRETNIVAVCRKLARRIFPIFFSITFLIFCVGLLDVQHLDNSTDQANSYGVVRARICAFK